MSKIKILAAFFLLSFFSLSESSAQSFQGKKVTLRADSGGNVGYVKSTGGSRQRNRVQNVGIIPASNSDKNQIWKFEKIAQNSTNTYYLQNQANGKYLHVNSDKNVILSAKDFSPKQQWEVRKRMDAVMLRSVASKLYLNVDGNNVLVNNKSNAFTVGEVRNTSNPPVVSNPTTTNPPGNPGTSEEDLLGLLYEEMGSDFSESFTEIPLALWSYPDLVQNIYYPITEQDFVDYDHEISNEGGLTGMTNMEYTGSASAVTGIAGVAGGYSTGAAIAWASTAARLAKHAALAAKYGTSAATTAATSTGLTSTAAVSGAVTIVTVAIAVGVGIYEIVKAVREQNSTSVTVMNTVPGLSVNVKYMAIQGGKLVGTDGKKYDPNKVVEGGAKAECIEDSRPAGLTFELHPSNGNGTKISGDIMLKVNYKGNIRYVKLNVFDGLAGAQSEYSLETNGLSHLKLNQRSKTTVALKSAKIGNDYNIYFSAEAGINNNGKIDLRKDIVTLVFAPIIEIEDVELSIPLSTAVTLDNKNSYNLSWQLRYTKLDGSKGFENIIGNSRSLKNINITRKEGTMFRVFAFNNQGREIGNCYLSGDSYLTVSGNKLSCDKQDVINATGDQNAKVITLDLRNTSLWASRYFVSSPTSGNQNILVDKTVNNKITKSYKLLPGEEVVVYAAPKSNQGRRTNTIVISYENAKDCSVYTGGSAKKPVITSSCN